MQKLLLVSKRQPLVPLPAVTQLDYWDFTSEFSQINVEKVPSELCWPDYSLTNQQNKQQQAGLELSCLKQEVTASFQTTVAAVGMLQWWQYFLEVDFLRIHSVHR